jgi:hypothetical protein
MLPGVSVVVETLLLGVHRRQLTYRIHLRPLADDEHPDQAARMLVGFHDTTPHDGRMLHSTSWRFDAGRIVLTYAALPDPHPATATALVDPPTAAAGTGPTTPSPATTTAADIVSHACRHLAFLHHTDPVVAAAAERRAALWTLIDTYRPGIAGGLHQPQPRQLSTR